MINYSRPREIERKAYILNDMLRYSSAAYRHSKSSPWSQDISVGFLTGPYASDKTVNYIIKYKYLQTTLIRVSVMTLSS